MKQAKSKTRVSLTEIHDQQENNTTPKPPYSLNQNESIRMEQRGQSERKVEVIREQ